MAVFCGFLKSHAAIPKFPGRRRIETPRASRTRASARGHFELMVASNRVPQSGHRLEKVAKRISAPGMKVADRSHCSCPRRQHTRATNPQNKEGVAVASDADCTEGSGASQTVCLSFGCYDPPELLLRPHNRSNRRDLQNYVQTGINLCTKDFRAVRRAAAHTRRATSLGVMVRPWWQEQTCSAGRHRTARRN